MNMDKGQVMYAHVVIVCFFFFIGPATTEIYTLSLHDALPISTRLYEIWLEQKWGTHLALRAGQLAADRSEEHTSELQSRFDLVCRLLLEKKKIKTKVPQSEVLDAVSLVRDKSGDSQVCWLCSH